MVDLSASADLKYKPTLFTVHKMLDEFVVGEHDSRMATFTNWLLAQQHVNMAGQRSSGKTHIVKNVCRLLPDKNGLYELTAGSDKSGYYEAEALKSHSHVMIPELNKLNKDARETLKSWGEGVAAKYRTVVFEGGTRRVQTYVLPPKPFIFCLADEEEENIDDQLRSRLTVIRTDISESQNTSVMEQQADLAINRDNPKHVDPIQLNHMKLHLGTLPPWNVDGFRHPAAKAFISSIPNIFTDCRRDFPKYLRNTYGITRFYWKERMSVDINGVKVLFVTPEDMYYNHVIYSDILVESSLRCSNLERQLISILQEYKDGTDKSTVQKAVRKRGMNISARMINIHMQNLADLGYVEILKASSAIVSYKAGSLFKDFTFEVNWKDVIKETMMNMKKYYPEVASEYIKRYCTNPTANHPFIGQPIEILKIKLIGNKSHDTFKDYSMYDKKESTGDLYSSNATKESSDVEPIGINVSEEPLGN